MILFFFFHNGFRWYQRRPQTQGPRRHQVARLSKRTTWKYWLMLKAVLDFSLVCLFVFFAHVSMVYLVFCSPHVPHATVT